MSWHLYKYCRLVVGLKEINRREIVVDASNTLRGSCELPSSLCMIKNPHSSSLPFLPLLLHHLLISEPLLSAAAPQSGSVASPSMLSPASRGQRNARIVIFFCPPPPPPLSLHWLSYDSLEYYALSLRVHVCVCSHGCGAPRWGPPRVRNGSCRESEMERESGDFWVFPVEEVVLWVACVHAYTMHVNTCANILYSIHTHIPTSWIEPPWYIGMADVVL